VGLATMHSTDSCR